MVKEMLMHELLATLLTWWQTKLLNSPSRPVIFIASVASHRWGCCCCCCCRNWGILRNDSRPAIPCPDGFDILASRPSAPYNAPARTACRQALINWFTEVCGRQEFCPTSTESDVLSQQLIFSQLVLLNRQDQQSFIFILEHINESNEVETSHSRHDSTADSPSHLV